ncbi:MAG: GDP-mannose 4,6-dehydratase, partial [Candidatus Omnitrophica bacterium]|nr:GDP-mannose 4,6-dehydratase [Candidatus Omnitrophota bacterium]
NSISLLEFIAKLEELTGKKISYTFSDWRPGDQKIYVSEIKKARRDFDWEPKVKVDEGIKRLLNWIKGAL